MCFIIRMTGVTARNLLAAFTMLLASTASHASSVSIELSGGTFGCCFDDGGPVSVAGSISNAVTLQDTASAEANIIDGVIRASAETNAWYSDDPVTGEQVSNLAFGQARATLQATFSNTTALEDFLIPSGEIGLTYDADYFINQLNTDQGLVQFQLRLDAFLRDDVGDLVGGVRRAWINHIVRFDDTTTSDNQPAGISPNLKTEINGGVVDAVIGPGGIDGQLYFSDLALSPGYTLELSLLLFTKADVTIPDGLEDISVYPSAKVDSSNTVRFFFNNPGLESDVPGSIDWPDSPTVIPVPAAAWLFCSGLVGLAGIARRKIR